MHNYIQESLPGAEMIDFFDFFINKSFALHHFWSDRTIIHLPDIFVLTEADNGWTRHFICANHFWREVAGKFPNQCAVEMDMKCTACVANEEKS